MSQDLNPTPHYGKLLKERRRTRKISVMELAKLSKVPMKRILMIEEDGVATLYEKEELMKAMLRFSILTGHTASVEAIQEQVDIMRALHDSFVQRLKNRLPVEIADELIEVLNELIVETSYYGVLMCRDGQEEPILTAVRARRIPE